MAGDARRFARGRASAGLDGHAALGVNTATSSPGTAMPKPRSYIRHITRTYYLSEWWDE